MLKGKRIKSVKSKQQHGNHDLPREIGTLSIGGGRIMLFHGKSSPEFLRMVSYDSAVERRKCS